MEELQFESADLELVAIDQDGLVDSLAVEVRAVERPDIACTIDAVDVGEFDMTSRHGHVIQENIALGVAASGDRFSVQRVTRSGFGPLVPDEDPGSFVETVTIGEVLLIGPIGVNGLDHRNRGSRIVGSPGNSFAAGRAVVRGWIVEVSTGRTRCIHADSRYSLMSASYAAASISFDWSPSSPRSTRHSHPSPYGSSLSTPGAASSASLISVTFPETGA